MKYAAAWSAGFVDGEGCIRIEKKGLVLRIAQTDPRPLQRLRGLYGGSIMVVKSPSRLAHYKPAWVYTLASVQCMQALRDMLPFLTVKAEEAKVAIEYQSGIVRLNNSNRESELARRLALRGKLKELKNAPSGLVRS